MKLDVKLEIEPYQGIAGVQFGMSCEQVRHALNSSVRAFKKTAIDELNTDAFDELGMHVYYKQPDGCEAIELAAPANPTFRGKALIGQPFSELRNWFRSIDPQIEVDETGLTSFEFGLGLYVPFASQSPNAPIEAVIIFQQGYYDR
ncbi:hypothetical protein [Sivoneniella epilithica]